MNNDSATLSPVAIPGASMPIQVDPSRELAALRPMVEHFGLDFRTQLRKLKGKSWATVVNMTTVGADGKTREMVGIDRRTTGMWLATLEENRVADEKRADLRAYQAEAADALDAYFHDGGVINPRATEDQLDRLSRQAQAQASVIQALRGVVDPKHLEAKGRIVLARAMGETPELDPAGIPLYVSDFLKSKGLASDQVAAKASGFGKRLKGLYVAEHGDAPRKAFQELPNGTVREVFAYTQADRGLFEQVWSRHYEGVTKAAA
ncbi:phage antirepressor N-terminal domain-containing protein [Prescottella equi]|uniref:phage antirepressor N-terminal domain-containing protein n=1 Tax=Rhodococcus hoagii TaxID=43767 RepID=UPI0007CD831E|nr:phage antirepressor N-terminal domain-containing protein [Prescottella equi]